MGCSINLKTLIPATTSGGQWELVGYSLIENGSYGTGGNWPWSTNPNEDPLVDFDNLIQGFYKLNYFVIGTCGGNVEVIIPAIGSGVAGITKTIDICDASTINIADELGTVFDLGILQASFLYSGSGVTSSGFVENILNNPLDNEFDTSLVSVGTYSIVLDIIPTSPLGYVMAECCETTSATLIINVLPTSSIAISLDATCKIHIDSLIGCDTATLQLYGSSTGLGTWIPVPFPASGTTFPFQTESAVYYRVTAIGCACGDIVSNIVHNAECCVPVTSNTWTLSMFGCVIYLTGSGCGGGIKKYYKSCDAQQTWTHIPANDGLNSFPVTDDCFYQCIIECAIGGNTCNEYTNIVQGDCSTCDDTLTVVKNSCEYSVTAGPACVVGEMQLFKVGTGIIDTIDLSTQGYPFDFPILIDGDYKAIFHCLTDGCPDIEGSILNYAESCGIECDSILSSSISSCLITAVITNCPSPTYTFKRPDTSIAYSGSNNTYLADIDGTWTILANGCPNCGQLSTTQAVASCENLCNCSATLSESTCGLLSLDLQACSSYSIQWQYKLLIGDSWINGQVGGNTFQSTLNGFYQCILSKAGCSDVTSNAVEVDCLISGCQCESDIQLLINSCVIEGSPFNCDGYILTMQHKLVGVWTNIGVFVAPWIYVPIDNNIHRVIATKAGCPDIYSNEVSVECVGSCQVIINSFIVDPSDCSKAIVTWSGAGGNDVVLQFSYAQVNPTDCNSASGWASWFHTGTGNFAGDGTGNYAVNNIPECYNCIRVIVDATNEDCSIATEKLLYPCCCTDTPTIEEQPISIEWDVKLFNSVDTENYIDIALINNSKFLQLSGKLKVYKEDVEQSSTPFSITSTDDSKLTSKVTPNGPNLVDGSVFSQINFTDGAGIAIIYGGLVYIGSFGTIISSELVFDSANPSIMQNAIEINILNYLETEGKGIEGLVVEINADGSFFIQSDVTHNPTNANLVYAGWIPIILPSGLYSMPPAGPETLANEFICPEINFTAIVPAGCGFVGIKRQRIINILDNTQLDTDIHLLNNTVELDIELAAEYPPLIICEEDGLKVVDYCIGATFLWSTGETVDHIEATSGNYSCIVTCPDECEYILNITI